MKDNANLVVNIKITTKNNVSFFAYLQRDHKVGVILTSTSAAISIEKAHIVTRYHDDK